MEPSPETLVRHELIGLDVTIVAASNPDLVDLDGRVVTETARTLGIETADDVAHVPKASATFEWALASGETVRTRGEILVSRPARRTELAGDSTWE